MKRTISMMFLALMLVGSALYAARPNSTRLAPPPTPEPEPRAQRHIDIVLALDISGSMSGLIDAARSKMWDVVNEFSEVQPAPRLRVALVTFGGMGAAQHGHVEVASDLTTDLDSVYAQLNALTTNGGEEYVGRAVHRAVNELDWSKQPDALRQIYVAGNESADQDRVTPVGQAVSLASARDIFVNAIFCGSEGSSDAQSWRTFATTGRGMFAAIDHNHGTVAIATPYDQQLERLSQEMNGTYVGYGRRAPARRANMARQDKNAARLAGAGSTRALSKASALYSQGSWDLVDAKKEGREVPRAALPEPMQKMSDEELDQVIATKSPEREAIKMKIRRLAKKRAAYRANEIKRRGIDESKSFDVALKSVIGKQAAQKGLSLK